MAEPAIRAYDADAKMQRVHEPRAADETLDRLSGDWWIYQLRRGHRYATDDVLTAWSALEARPDATRLLDLGAGVGSVGLLTLQVLPEHARLTSVEVLEQSAALLGRTVRHNGIEGRVEIRLGDLRDSTTLAGQGPFDLVVANPPFLPEGTGWTSPVPQRSSARFEQHGDVYDFCAAAARHLGANGRFCFCFAAGDERPERAIHETGLRLVRRRHVSFRTGRPPRLTLYDCAGDDGATREPDESLCVRDEAGQRTHSYLAVMRKLVMVE